MNNNPLYNKRIQCYQYCTMSNLMDNYLTNNVYVEEYIKNGDLKSIKKILFDIKNELNELNERVEYISSNNIHLLELCIRYNQVKIFKYFLYNIIKVDVLPRKLIFQSCEYNHFSFIKILTV